MLNINLKNLVPDDVSDLHGLLLNMAFAIHIYDWKWYKRDQDGMKYVLLDTAPLANRALNKEFFRLIGDQRYVAKSLPKFEKRLLTIINLVFSLEDEQQQRRYMRWLEDEIYSTDHFEIAHANSEQRLRAYLKMVLEDKQIKEKQGPVEINGESA